MSAPRSGTIKISELKPNLFVRQAINDDHVLFLAGLLEGGVKLPPIEITKDNVVVDGRHRIEAHKIVDRDEIDYKVVDAESDTELIGMAYRANLGGALPPTPQDTEHTVMELLRRDVTMKAVGELLGLPTSMARKYAKAVKGKMTNMDLQRAATLVTEGNKTVAEAAAEVGVDPDRLKQFMSGHRKRRKAIEEIQRTITKRYKSLASSNAAMFKDLSDAFQDGDLGQKQVEQILSHIESLIRAQGRVVEDWRARFKFKAKTKNSRAA